MKAAISASTPSKANDFRGKAALLFSMSFVFSEFIILTPYLPGRLPASRGRARMRVGLNCVYLKIILIIENTECNKAAQLLLWRKHHPSDRLIPLGE
jgi:hypothetical protein